MYGLDILCAISKATCEIQSQISYQYIESCEFHTTLKSLDLSDLKAHMRFWNGPRCTIYNCKCLLSAVSYRAWLVVL